MKEKFKLFYRPSDVIKNIIDGSSMLKCLKVLFITTIIYVTCVVIGRISMFSFFIKPSFPVILQGVVSNVIPFFIILVILNLLSAVGLKVIILIFRGKAKYKDLIKMQIYMGVPLVVINIVLYYIIKNGFKTSTNSMEIFIAFVTLYSLHLIANALSSVANFSYTRGVVAYISFITIIIVSSISIKIFYIISNANNMATIISMESNSYNWGVAFPEYLTGSETKIIKIDYDGGGIDYRSDKDSPIKIAFEDKITINHMFRRKEKVSSDGITEITYAVTRKGIYSKPSLYRRIENFIGRY